MVQYNTVATNAGPDAVSGLSHDAVWKGEDVNATKGEDISMGADRAFDVVENDSAATKKPAAKKAAAPKSD